MAAAEVVRPRVRSVGGIPEDSSEDAVEHRVLPVEHTKDDELPGKGGVGVGVGGGVRSGARGMKWGVKRQVMGSEWAMRWEETATTSNAPLPVQLAHLPDVGRRHEEDHNGGGRRRDLRQMRRGEVRRGEAKRGEAR